MATLELDQCVLRCLLGFFDRATEGETHISVNTMNAELRWPQEHVQAIRRYKETLGA